MDPGRVLSARVKANRFLFLGGGLATASLLVPAVQRLFGWLRAFETELGVALLPAVLIMAVALLLHVVQGRLASTEAKATADAALLAADVRAKELENLVTFGRATADALDLTTLRDAVRASLAGVSDGRDAWALLKSASGEWQELAQVSSLRHTASWSTLQALATDALQRLSTQAVADGPAHVTLDRDGESHACFPLLVAGQPVGVLGVITTQRPLSPGGIQRQAAAAALLAVGAKNVQMVREIRDLSMRDALTGCANRTQAVETLRLELRRAQRSRRPVSIIMLDLDHFKMINDRWGHLAGDAALAHMGRVLQTTLRTTDFKARYGGEEFILVLPDTPLAAATIVAEGLRQTIAQSPASINGHDLTLTASLGVATASLREVDESTVIARADAALYTAKREGRNCVRVHELPDDMPATDAVADDARQRRQPHAFPRDSALSVR